MNESSSLPSIEYYLKKINGSVTNLEREHGYTNSIDNDTKCIPYQSNVVDIGKNKIEKYDPSPFSKLKVREKLTRVRWTSEENDRLIKLHHRYGNKWSKLAKELPGRSPTAIKNHFHCLQQK